MNQSSVYMRDPLNTQSESKLEKKIYDVISKHKKYGKAILVADKIYFERRSITRDKVGQF